MLPPYNIWSILPHLQSTESPFQHNDSPHHFFDPFQDAYEALVDWGAVPQLKDIPNKGRKQASGTDQPAQQDSFDPTVQFNLPNIKNELKI